MKKVFTYIDEHFQKIIGVAAAAILIGLVVITVIQVLARYVFRVSLGGLEELPVYLFLVAVWATSMVNARKKSDISIDFIFLAVKGETGQKVIHTITDALTTIVLILFAGLSVKFLKYCIDAKTTTAGLRIPYALFSAIITVAAIINAIYYAAHVGTDIASFRKKKEGT